MPAKTAGRAMVEADDEPPPPFDGRLDLSHKSAGSGACEVGERPPAHICHCDFQKVVGKGESQGKRGKSRGRSRGRSQSPGASEDNEGARERGKGRKQGKR